MDNCALCGKKAKLCNSHIFPELMYKRIALNKKSRFRELNNIGRVWQDGEKRKLLCRDCEELFSSYETKFARWYDENRTAKNINRRTNEVNNCIISVAWRLLYDDLYRLNSFEDNIFLRGVYEDYCQELKEYLLCLENDRNQKPPKFLKISVYKLNKFIKDKSAVDFFNGELWGYPVFFYKTAKASVVACFGGLVYEVEYLYDKNKYIFLSKRRLWVRRVHRKELNDEVLLQLDKIIELFEKIPDYITEKAIKYYDKPKNIEN